MIKKHLVFHFYVPKEYKENEAIRIHLQCLRMYSHVFDSAVFAICFEEKTEELIDEVEKDILSLGFKNDVRIVVVENTLLTESVTFKRFVLDEIDRTEGMVFFGHTKGVTNKETYKSRWEDIKKWIVALYFYPLEFVDEAEKKMFYPSPWQITFFGPLMTTYDECKTFNYPGTFFWLNPQLLYNDIKIGMVEIPKMANRSFTEDLPFIYKTGDFCHRVTSHNGIWTHPCGYYNVDFDMVIDYFGDRELFNERYNKINDSIK